MDGVEGIEVVKSPRREEIQEICKTMCSWERYYIKCKMKESGQK